MSQVERPQVSIIIPVRNGGAEFRQCLESITTSDFRDFELIVFNDGSTDGSEQLAVEFGARVFNQNHVTPPAEPIEDLKHCYGPAQGRNQAAEQARADILFFVDADVAVEPTTVGRIVTIFEQSPELSAVFGSYDFAPAKPNFLSQFRNLLHSFVHQTSQANAQTFWAGCGAIRTSAFRQLGGFDGQRYRFPAVEDIELGYRLSEAGHSILLDRELRVKHLKRWSLSGMLVADVLHRAIPWLQILYSQRRMANDLNLKHRSRLSGAFSALSLLCLSLLVVLLPMWIWGQLTGSFDRFPLARHTPWYAGLAALPILAVVILNVDFYLFIYKLRGAWFVLRAIPVHCMFYAYSSLALAVFLIDHHWPSFRRLRKWLGVVSHVQR